MSIRPITTMGDSGILQFLPLLLSNPATLETFLGLIERAQFPIGLTQGPDHRLVLANEAYRLLSGLNVGQELAVSARMAFPSNLTGDHGTLLEDAYSNGKAHHLAEVGSGSPEAALYDVEYQPMRGPGGDVEGVLIIGLDAGPRVLARHRIESVETALREHERRLQLALNAADLGEWEYDLETDILIRSPVVDSMYGFADGEGPAHLSPFLERIEAEDRRAIVSELEAIRQGATSLHADYRVRKPDGRISWLACRGEVVDESGPPRRVVGILMDVTERKQTETTLREREARFRELADAMPQIVWSAGPDGRVDYYNRRSMDYTRAQEGNAPDRGWRDSIHPDDVHTTLERWHHSIATGEIYEIEYRFKDPQSGDYRWHLGRALPIHGKQGQIVRWLGTSTDIDDQKRAEQELAAALAEKDKLLDLKTALLREINHRVKNSLQLVSSLLNLQGRNINDPEVRFRFDEATRRVLTVARVHERLYETDNVDRMEFAQFLRDLCYDIAVSLSSRAKRHKLTIDAPSYDVLVDQAIPLALVVNELVTNAFKYAFEDDQNGEVSISLTLHESEIRLVIADNGRGLPKDFDVGKSRGLGMILVNALTRQLKGQLEFEHGQPGATFILSAPRIKDVEPGLRLTSARAP